MIDIHTHIIHGVDDGSGTLEESVAILKSAALNGVTDVICTSHYLSPEEFNKEQVLENFHVLKEKIKEENININLHLGSETAVYGRADKLFAADNLVTLADSKYILIEFPMAIDVDYVLDAVYEARVRKLVPVIAHPERCECFRRDYDLILKAIDEGALIQCNLTSLMGDNGHTAKNIVKRLLKEKKVHFFATDTHSILRNRYDKLNKMTATLEKLVGRAYKNKLLEYNARAILMNEDIEK